jgi:MHS family proline/betaine transporter-like MFS transporter
MVEIEDKQNNSNINSNTNTNKSIENCSISSKSIKINYSEERIFLVVVSKYWREVSMLIFLLTGWGPIFYVCFVWIPIYQADILARGGVGLYDPWNLNVLMLTIHTVLMPVFGYFIDKFADTEGNNSKTACKFGLYFSSMLMMGLAFPAFFCLSSSNPHLACLGYLFIVAPSALFGASMSPFMVYQFPVKYRLTGLGLSFNLVQAMFVSSATALVTVFAERAGIVAPAYYIVAMAVISLVTQVIFVPLVEAHRTKENLNNIHSSGSLDYFPMKSSMNNVLELSQNSGNSSYSPLHPQQF